MATRSDSVRRARPLLGTIVEIAAEAPPGCDLAAAVEAAFAAVERVHRLMSFHDPASDVSRLNREATTRPIRVDAWTFEVIVAAVDLRRRSQGLFDVTIAPALQRLGLLPFFDRVIARRVAPLPRGGIETLPGRRVRFRDAGVRIDLGGIAKGFAVDRALQALRAHGASDGLVNAGGDLAAFGRSPARVHLRDPCDPRRLLGRADIMNEALASSGGRFDPSASDAVAAPAVIDTRTGEPARAVAGVTVRAHSCMIADALTKVAMIAGTAAADLLDRFGASALMVLHGGDLRVTPSWQNTRAA